MNQGSRLLPKVAAAVAVIVFMPAALIAPASARLSAAESASDHRTVMVTRPIGRLGPLLNIRQTWNNCGPASVAEVLDYWHIRRSQAQVAAVLRADGDPRGMAPFGIPAYARAVGLRSLLGVYGNQQLLKALISNGFPVIANQWISVYNHDRHYRPIESYDDHQRVFVSSDPYLGPGHTITYAEFEQLWTVSNRRFIVLYPPSKQALLDAVLASAGWDRTRAFLQDRAKMQARLRGDGPVEQSWGLDPLMYPYLNLAWDELQLGHYAAAREALRAAAAHDGAPLVIQWIKNEMPSSPEG